METILLVLFFLGYTGYLQYNFTKEKESLIKEMAIAIKSNNVNEYKEAVEDNEDNKVEVVKDELISIDDVSAEVLLRSLR